jgi:hypothetical protein
MTMDSVRRARWLLTSVAGITHRGLQVKNGCRLSRNLSNNR